MAAAQDSGPAHTLSPHRGGSESVNWEPTAQLTAVGGAAQGGKKVGHLGVLRPNNLGLTAAVYLPEIAAGRLVSTTELNGL